MFKPNNHHKKILSMKSPTNYIYQYQHQTRLWLKSLVTLADENIDLKNKITLVVKNSHYNEMLLERVEYFHNKLLEVDLKIISLRKEIKSHHDILNKDVFIDSVLIVPIHSKQNKLGRKLDLIDFEIRSLQIDFKNCFSIFSQVFQNVHHT